SLCVSKKTNGRLIPSKSLEFLYGQEIHSIIYQTSINELTTTKVSKTMQNNNDIKAYPPEYTYGDFNMGLPGQENPPVPPQSAMTSATKVEESKAIAEIKAAVLMAKQCPR